MGQNNLLKAENNTPFSVIGEKDVILCVFNYPKV